MIRYSVTKAQLETMIRAKSGDWMTRAADRTKKFKTAGRFVKESSIWSEIKPVYMDLQMGKCAYCERQMESPKFGKVEQDVEHFRPKGNVKSWDGPKKLKDDGIKFTAVPGKKKGYHLLAYHILNYAAACKPCNSALKSDRFPIAGKYNLEGDDPAKLKSEKPYLIYPIGEMDEDPEKLITFNGAFPVPTAKGGHSVKRAKVTIEFFKLDDAEGRGNLFSDRALLLVALFHLLQETTTGTVARKAKAKKIVTDLLTPKLKHLNCAKSFVRLFESDPMEARGHYNKALLLVTSGS